MTKLPRIFMLIAFTASPSLCVAFFCPNNFNSIDFGYTTDQVIQQCGKPDKEETKEIEALGPQEWVYFIPQAVAMSSMQTEQGTLKTSIAFDKDGNAINITVNGIGVGASTICGPNIQLGQSRDAIKAACGEPSSINKSANPANSEPPKKTKVTTFIYNSNPNMKLVFENGILKSK